MLSFPLLAFALYSYYRPKAKRLLCTPPFFLGGSKVLPLPLKGDKGFFGTPFVRFSGGKEVYRYGFSTIKIGGQAVL
jgi:hypothetical protein